MDIQYIRTPRNLPDDQCTRIAVKNLAGEVVSIMTLGEKLDDGASLAGLQQSLDDDMKGNFGSSPAIDREAAERARERAVAAAGGPGKKLFISWATPEEIRAFELLQRRVN
jgi:hypothetical protein